MKILRRTLRLLLLPLGLVTCAGALEVAARIVHLGRAPILPYYFEDGAAFLPSHADIRASFYWRRPNRYVTDDGGARIFDPSLHGTRLREGVLVAGDSQALGYMLDFEHTFASRVATALVGGPEHARILAAPANQPETLLTALARYAPEHQRLAVVVLNLGNDLDEMYSEAASWTRERTPPLERWLVSHSFFYMDFRLLRSRALIPPGEALGVNRVAYMLDVGERIVLAREAARCLAEAAARIPADRHLVLIVPADVQLDLREFEKYRRYYATPAEFEQWHQRLPATAAAMATLEGYIAGQLERGGLHVLRLSQIPELAAAREPVFDDTSHHITTYAHRVVSQAILAHLDADEH